MPNTGFFDLSINNAQADVADLQIKMTYRQDEPENWEDVLSDKASVSLPATRKNDQIFNTYHNLSIADLTPDRIFSKLMPFVFSANGVTILKGSAKLLGAALTDKPEEYGVELQGGNGDWIALGQNMSLFDCLSTATHAFTVANVQKSWESRLTGGFDSDEDHDYVYAPVRYRQPFEYVDLDPGSSTFGQKLGNDDRVSIYALRPALSVYWMIIRGFRNLGYRVSSTFLESQFFRRQVMPWTWGGFLDISNQVTKEIGFKAVGKLTTSAMPSVGPVDAFFTGYANTPTWTIYNNNYAAGDGYIKTETFFSDEAVFQMNNTAVPYGYDNLLHYSFEESTGKMNFLFEPPAALSEYIGNNISINFALSLYLAVNSASGSQIDVLLEVSINGTIVSTNSIIPGGAVVGDHYPTSFMGTFPLMKISVTPTTYKFTVDGVNQGDTITFRLKYSQSGGTAASVLIMQSGYLDTRPSELGASPWQYDAAGGKWNNVNGNALDPVWQQVFSTIEMTGFQLQLGSSVNFRFYDAFRNYRFFDMLGGLVDSYDLQIATDADTNTVYIEPCHSVTVPNYNAYGTYIGNTSIPGFYDTTKLVDWTSKQDLSKRTFIENFTSYSRQVDFSMKMDGNDGGQNILAARYKGLNLSLVTNYRIQSNSNTVNNGQKAAIPGASRYVFPQEFNSGNKQKNNRFFSSVIHYNHSAWANLYGFINPAPQLIAIIPDNISDASATAVESSFQPKLAFYKGLSDPASYGGWYWVGDPANPYDPTTAVTFPLPFMFAINYGSGGQNDPVLSYSDQKINGQLVPGLMKKFFLKRLAIMRNGKLVHTHFRLNLDDINRGMRNPVSMQGKGVFARVQVKDFNPLDDSAAEVTMWQIVSPDAADEESSYPSADSVLNSPAELTDPQDLKYVPQLILATDLPQ